LIAVLIEIKLIDVIISHRLSLWRCFGACGSRQTRNGSTTRAASPRCC